METIDRIKQTAKEKGISISFLCEKVGMQRTYLNDVQKRNGIIPDDRLRTIAECLGVSTSYLLGKTNEKEKPAEETPAVGVVVSRNGLRTSVELKPEDAQMIEELIKKIRASYGEE